MLPGSINMNKRSWLQERVKTAEVAEVAEVARAPSRPASTKVEQTAVSLQHGYELGEKTDCKQCANIHRGRVTERKLESSAKIREMTIGVGHELVSVNAVVCQSSSSCGAVSSRMVGCLEEIAPVCDVQF